MTVHQEPENPRSYLEQPAKLDMNLEVNIVLCLPENSTCCVYLYMDHSQVGKLDMRLNLPRRTWSGWASRPRIVKLKQSPHPSASAWTICNLLHPSKLAPVRSQVALGRNNFNYRISGFCVPELTSKSRKYIAFDDNSFPKDSSPLHPGIGSAMLGL